MTSGETSGGKAFPNEEAYLGDPAIEAALPTTEAGDITDTPASEPLLDLGPIEELPEFVGMRDGVDVSAELAQAAQKDAAIEAKKTLCSAYCFDYLYAGGNEAYEKLTRAQKDKTKRLRRDQFDRGHAELRELIQTPEDATTFKYIISTHDNLKRHDIVAAMGLAQANLSHDVLIGMLFNDPVYLAVRKKYFPTFDKLSAEQQDIVRRVFAIRFDYAQAMQGEAPAAIYAHWPEHEDPKIKGFAKWESKLDIAGTLGHRNQTSSIVLTAKTYEYMEMMDAALDAPGLTPAERQKMYLFSRVRAYGIPQEYLDDPANEAEMIALGRMACQLRLETEEQFAFLQQRFNRLPPAVTAVVIEELNKTGIDDAAALAEYSPAMLAALLKALDSGFVVPFAQFLHEISVANAESEKSTERGIIAAQLGELVTKLNTNQMQGGLRKIEFVRQGEAFVPRELQPTLQTVESLSIFDSERFRGKDVIIITNSGGDALSGYLTAKLLRHQVDANVQAIAVNRTSSSKQIKNIINAGEWPGRGVTWQKLTNQTFRRPGESWRFAEMGILQDPEAPKVFWTATRPLQDSDPRNRITKGPESKTDFEVATNANLDRLLDRFGPDFVLGIDPGFDSGWTEQEVRNGEVGLPHLLTDADHRLVRYLGRLDAERELIAKQPYEPRNFMVMPTPGLYGPSDSLRRLHDMEAKIIEQRPDDSLYLIQTLAKISLMGAPNKEIYSTTIAVQKAALLGLFGIQAIDLPEQARKEHWRRFFDVTPAMAQFVIAPARDHWRVISAPDSPYGGSY